MQLFSSGAEKNVHPISGKACRRRNSLSHFRRAFRSASSAGIPPFLFSAPRKRGNSLFKIQCTFYGVPKTCYLSHIRDRSCWFIIVSTERRAAALVHFQKQSPFGDRLMYTKYTFDILGSHILQNKLFKLFLQINAVVE